MRSFLTALVLLIALAALPRVAAAQVSIPWFTLDSGGGISTGGGYTLKGTIGQIDSPATTSGSHGGPFTFIGGYWDLPSIHAAAAARGRASLAPGPAADSIVYCPADFNSDEVVNISDLFGFLEAYFAEDPRADFDDSRAIGVEDLFGFLSAYIAGCK